MKIKEIIDARNLATLACEDKIREAIANWLSRDSQTSYRPDYIAAQLESTISNLTDEDAKTNRLLNGQLNKELTDLREQAKSAYYPAFEKPADYSTQIANALQTISLLGSSLTDEDAHTILKPFENDYDQMSIFERVLACVPRADDSQPTSFDKTFSTFYKARETMALCDETLEIARELFTYQKQPDDGRAFNGRLFSARHDTYDEIDGQQKVIEKVGEIERSLRHVE